MSLKKKGLLIAIGGMSGTGKTTLAKALAEKFPGATHLDSDVTRKKLFGVDVMTRLPAEAYTFAASQRLMSEMTKITSETLARGETIIVSSTFAQKTSSAGQAKLAGDAGADFVGIVLEADLQELFSRVSKRVNDASDAGVDIVEKQSRQKAGFPPEWKCVNAGQPQEKVLKDVMKIIHDAGVKPFVLQDCAVKPPKP